VEQFDLQDAPHENLADEDAHQQEGGQIPDRIHVEEGALLTVAFLGTEQGIIRLRELSDLL